MAKTLPQVDPNVKVPAAIRAAAAKADGAHEAKYGKPEVKKADPLEQVVTPVEPIVKPEPKVEAAPAPAPVEVKPVTPEVTPEVTADVKPAEVAPVAKPAPAADTYEHKYNSMKGRHDRLAEQVRSMSEQLAAAQDFANAMKSAPPAPVPTELDAKSLLTPEQRAEYGDEFLDVVGRKAKESLTPEVVALRAQVASLQQKVDRVDTTISQSDRKRYFTDLHTLQPGWETINNDSNFLNWLALPDTYSGAIRHELLRAAYDRCDATRVAAFFQGFLAEEAATAPRDPAPDFTAPVTPAAPKVSLESLAAPGRAKTTAPSTPPGPAEKPTFTSAQVTDFYVDVRRNKYRGNEAEKNRIEALIIAAGREGRIR